MRKNIPDKFIINSSIFVWVHAPTDPFPMGALAPTVPG